MKIFNLKTILITVICFVSMSIQSHAQQGTVTVNQDKKIDALLNLRKEMNKNENASDRYKIQIYSGNRVTAESMQADFRSKFGDWEPTIKFETPNYKVWVGSFRNRLEADRALKDIRPKFSSAFIFRPKK